MSHVVRRKVVRRLAVGLTGLAFLGVIAWAVWPSPVPVPIWAADYDVSARPPEAIPPGTVIDRSAPVGWSHLVVKSLPRVRPEHREKVNALTARMTSWMFAAFIADVQPEKRDGATRYRLRAVALGLGTSINGRDTIITPETAAQHGIQLNLITRPILTKGYEIQRLAVVVVHGPTLGLVDTPVWYRCGEKNRLIRFRYALLVDGLTGRLDVVVWALDPEDACGDSSSAVVLAANTIDEAELVPDLSKFTAGLTTAEDGFGVDRLPPHRTRLLLAPDLRDLAAKTKFTPDEPRDLEAGLRRLLDARPPH
jgi:hypothetical protein